MSNSFKLQSNFKPLGDQPQAIEKLTRNLREGFPFQTLLGVTGSGKTFTMASVIQNVQKPTLIISHNKTLAAQLYQEFREFFPENAVHYFVSYYDYYQPEAYMPQTDTYIEKDAKINELIDKLRHASTQSILSRNDVIIVASVSCIYGIGEPMEYEKASIALTVGDRRARKDVLRALAKLQFTRNDLAPLHGTYGVRGEVVEVRSMTGLETIRLEWESNTIEQISVSSPTLQATGYILRNSVRIFPAKHFVTPQEKLAVAVENIKLEFKERLAVFKKEKRLLEAQRLEQRTRYDLEMIKETGYCNGIENYARQLDFRKPGQPPATLIDFFKHAFGKNWLLFIDESHMSVPQVRGMYNGDRARKEVLINYGFRLPSALDNRPLKFDEFEKKIPQTIFVSATPSLYEFEKSKAPEAWNLKPEAQNQELSAKSYQLKASPAVAEQLIRPTGLVDPAVEVLPTKDQIPHLLGEIKKCIARQERALVLTLTKRLAEELADYLADKKLKVRYLHADVKTMERPEILKNLRKGTYDVLVGINLLREGLDLPEVSLVAILDADKEGFLRNDVTLLQTIGRAARNVNGRIIMYADTVTGSMKRAIEETRRRRKVQEAYNRAHSITPQTIKKAVKDWEFASHKEAIDPMQQFMKELLKREGYKDLGAIVHTLEKEMKLAARSLEFERAASIRDQITALRR